MQLHYLYRASAAMFKALETKDNPRQFNYSPSSLYRASDVWEAHNEQNDNTDSSGLVTLSLGNMDIHCSRNIADSGLTGEGPGLGD